ncbi:hypothetical protein M1494_00370 [Candidatus Parvarchaeota archaeon]|nr:hypothetical protein [Candidatus Parvarchaeota archaeon]
MENQDSFIIRPLKISDFDSAAELLSDTTKVTGLNRVDPILGEEMPGKRTNSYIFDRFARIYRDVINGNAIAVVAEDKGRILGFCYAVGNVWPESPHIAELRTPIIRTEDMDRGIGGAMINEIKRQAKGKFEILSLVISSDDEAITKKLESIYSTQLGFVRWGLAPKFYKKEDKYYPLIFMYSFV